MDLHVAVTTFALILPVELPDKTFVAALVLATRYRPAFVWIGVGAAFFVQTLVAVTAGQLVTLLPHWLFLSIAAAIFCLGAVVLLRTARSAEDAQRRQQEEYARKGGEARTALHTVGASFLVLFLAEWGDLSQLLTVSQVARTGEPVSVFVGAWSALLVISGLAVFVGRMLLGHLRLRLLHYLGAAVCGLLAVLTVVELVRL